jgi:hypothetical protein
MSLAAIDALETAELVEYCTRYYPARVYTVSGAGAGLGADGAGERERESERAQRIRDVRVGWLLVLGMGWR